MPSSLKDMFTMDFGRFVEVVGLVGIVVSLSFLGYEYVSDVCDV